MRARVSHSPNQCFVQYNIYSVLKKLQILIPKQTFQQNSIKKKNKKQQKNPKQRPPQNPSERYCFHFRQRKLISKPQELLWNGIIICWGAPVPICLTAIVMKSPPSLACELCSATRECWEVCWNPHSAAWAGCASPWWLCGGFSAQPVTLKSDGNV